MNVALVDVDSRIANLALMKAATFHRFQGDRAELVRIPYNWLTRSAKPLVPYDAPRDVDRAYVSCTFTWNASVARAVAEHFRQLGAEVLMGGTGFDHGKPSSQRTYLPVEIEHAPPDYSLYGVDYAVGFCNRGCNRSCQFCDVPLKEGKIIASNYRPPWTWVPDGFKKAMLLDNDIALYEDQQLREILGWFIESGVRCSITQGWDIRSTTPERAALLHELRPWDTKFRETMLYFAWDYLGIEGWVREKVPLLLDAGFKGRQMTCYTICGFPAAMTAPERCPWDGADLTGPHAPELHRYKVLWEEYGVHPFVTQFNNRRDDPWLNAFARFINRKLFKSCSWEDYQGNPERVLLHPPDRYIYRPGYTLTEVDP